VQKKKTSMRNEQKKPKKKDQPPVDSNPRHGGAEVKNTNYVNGLGGKNGCNSRY